MWTANGVKTFVSTTGTGASITLGSVFSGLYQTLTQAKVADGELIRYRLEDGASAWELCEGVVGGSGTTVSRTTLDSSNHAGPATPISLSGAAVFSLTPTAEDFDFLFCLAAS